MERHRHGLFFVRTGRGCADTDCFAARAFGDWDERQDVRPTSFEGGARNFDRPQPKVLPIPTDQSDLVVHAMWSVVNVAGTATGIKMAGFDIAGKTGTAQVVGLGKEGREHKDHSWFVSYAPA